MDALALLCTLYADGPATLQRLRGQGCESLAILLELEPPILTERMGWDERLSIRFLREAQNLADRLDVGWAEEDGGDRDEAPGRVTVAPAPPVAPPSDRQQRETLMAHWRALDQEQPPAGPEGGPAAAPAAPAAPPPAPQEDPRLGLLGLRPEQLASLREKGILGLRTLAERDTFDLARLLQLPYTRAQRLQLLAKRSELHPVPRANGGDTQGVRTQDASPASARSAGRWPEPRDPSPKAGAPGSLDAAGPFA